MNPKLTTSLVTLTAAISGFTAGTITSVENDKIIDIVTEQAAKEKYVQVLEGGRTPEGEPSLQTKLPSNMSIDTIDGPEGKGYRILTKYPDKEVSIGIGAYAEGNTYVKEIAPLIASSSPQK